MSATSIGGFFVDLGLVTDEKSFLKGTKQIDAVALVTKKLLGTALKTAGALFGMATAAGVLANSEEKSARAIGISVTQLEKWKAVADIAGVSSSSLIQNMASLEEKAQRMKFGEVDDKMAESLAWLGVNQLDFADMDAETRMKTIFDKASQGDIKANAIKVKDILGDAGMELFLKVQESGKSLEDYLKKASSLMFTDDASAKKGEMFSEEFNTLKAQIKSIANLFGTELGDKLLPVIKDLTNFLTDNKENIKKGIHNITHPGEAIEEQAKKTGESTSYKINSVSPVAPIATVSSVSSAFSSSPSLVNNNYIARLEDAKREYERILSDPNASERKKKSAQKGLEKINGNIEKARTIQDGIIAPGGKVTQVAPDDWVFAARDIGKLATAFAPRTANGVTQATFSINQNITINGARDIPASIKSAAYNGANKAFEEMSHKSANMLQLMPVR